MSSKSLHGLGPTRAKVLSVLQSSAVSLSAAQIARKLDLHINSARFQLDSLVEAGYACKTTLGTGKQGRPSLVYKATENSPDLDNTSLIELAQLLINNFVLNLPDANTEIEKAGFNWGVHANQKNHASSETANDKLSNLVEYLTNHGFVTRSLQEPTRLLFSRCPFRPIAENEKQLKLFCSLHNGMIKGYLSIASTPLEVSKLVYGPHICEIQLTNSSSIPC